MLNAATLLDIYWKAYDASQVVKDRDGVLAVAAFVMEHDAEICRLLDVTEDYPGAHRAIEACDKAIRAAAKGLK